MTPRANALLLFAFLSSCSGEQSTFDPGGGAADTIAQITTVLFVGATVIFIGVVVGTLYALRGRYPFVSERSVVALGIVFPIVTLSALLTYTLTTTAALTAAAPANAVRIEVIGKMWWWKVIYRDDTGKELFTTANELHLPVGRAADIRVRSDDVIHSFWVPRLAGKIDMIPGRTNRIVLRPEQTGIFRGQCAEYCGLQHSWMAMHVVVVDEGAFETWMISQTATAHSPATDSTRLGETVFLTNGCGTCHTVRGTRADGMSGPDLTHVGSRLQLGAGMMPNTVDNLAAWIADSQRFKNENGMPPFRELDGITLRALAEYMVALQ